MNWDQGLVFLVVLAAAGYLLNRWRVGRKGACGGCGTCGSQKQTSATPAVAPVLVQLDATPRHRANGTNPIAHGSGHSSR